VFFFAPNNANEATDVLFDIRQWQFDRSRSTRIAFFEMTDTPGLFVYPDELFIRAVHNISC